MAWAKGVGKKSARGIVAMLVSCGAIVACSAPASGPSNGTYTVGFPSVAAAVSTETLQLYVFDAGSAQADSGGGSYCEQLVLLEKNNQPLPATIATAGPSPLCVFQQSPPSATISYGLRALMVIGQRGGKDYVIGCNVQTIGGGNAPDPIDLNLISTDVAVPPTTCTSLTQFCPDGSKCPTQ